MLLLVTAALLARTAIQAMRADAGFDVNRLLTVSISDGRTKFDEAGYLHRRSRRFGGCLRSSACL